MAIIKLEEGRYAIRWRDARGKRHYETLPDNTPFAKVKELHAQRIVERRKARRSEATVAMLCRDYLEMHDVHAKQPFTPLGRKRAESIVERIEKDPLGAMVTDDTKAKHFLQWRMRRKADGVSDATLDREWNYVRAALNHAVRTDEIAELPIKPGTVQRLVPAHEGKVIHFTPEEWRAFISGVADDTTWLKYMTDKRRLGPVKIGATVDTPRRFGGGWKPEGDAAKAYRARLLALAPYFRVLLLTGARLSEVRLMTWEQVDFRGGYVTLRQSKVAKPKVIPMGAMRADFESLKRGIGKAYVFVTPEGEPYTVHQIMNAFDTYRAVAGLRDELTVHAIRHTVATWMVIGGRSLKEVQEFLGHSSMNMTLKYAHMAPVHLKDAQAAIVTMSQSTTNEDGSARPISGQSTEP